MLPMKGFFFWVQDRLSYACGESMILSGNEAYPLIKKDVKKLDWKQGEYASVDV